MPDLANGAYEDNQQRRVPIIFLAGPIKHWWTCWGSPEHLAYVAHRDAVRSALIEAGYLTYASWDAFKGSWDPRAQVINDAAIGVSSLLIVMTPPGVPADGTEDEVEYAEHLGVSILWVPPGSFIFEEEGKQSFLAEIRRLAGEGVPYQ